MHIKKLLPLLFILIQGSTTLAQVSREYSELISKASELYDKKEYKESAEYYSQAFGANGDKGSSNDRYNAACSYALAGNSDSAFKQLFRIAEKFNYSNLSHLISDPDLDLIHSDKRWNELVALVKSNKDKAEEGMNKPVIAILDTVFQDDQKYRMELEGLEAKYGVGSKELKAQWKIIGEKDSINTIKITNILDKYGWLGPDEVGGPGANTIFLVIQHADIDIQKKYLPMMRTAVKNKKAAPSALALLEDRVALREGKKQIYGSQVARDNESGEYYVQPLEDPDHVDERRAAVGLQPLADYVRRWKIVWDVEDYKKKLPEYEKKR